MRRREFISVLGGAAAWPLAARAQQRERMRRVGVLIGSEDNTDARVLFAEFRQALEHLGWSYGNNIQIDIVWGSDEERRVTYAKELVRLNPDVIFAGPSNVVLTLQRETRSIPIVFVRASDPVVKVSSTVSPSPAGISPASAIRISPCWGNGCNFSRMSSRA